MHKELLLPLAATLLALGAVSAATIPGDQAFLTLAQSGCAQQ
jgi:hypothetical protein